MKKQWCLLILCMPTFLMAQEQSAINWTQGITWQQIKAKAKEENKYIFVDCYTTWCKPCKLMEKDVYTIDSVGSYLNDHFISVKLQMDINAKDNEEVKNWYKTARAIEKQYQINSYPSYLFFSPGGEVVSKNGGYKQPGEFLQVVRDATNPNRQYFVLLKKYKKGKLDNAGSIYLIKQAKQIGDTADYHQLLDSYYAYLNKQKSEKLYTKENIEFIASTLENSHQLLFRMFYPDGKKVNNVMQNDWYSKHIVDRIISREKVQPFLEKPQKGLEPDWNILYRLIEKDYKGDYADRHVLNTKVTWYSSRGDFLNAAKCFNDEVEKYGTDTTALWADMNLNNFAWLLFFEKVTDKKELERAVGWMAGVARRGEKCPPTGFAARWDTYLDTYANLLHKAGRTAEAIKWEELALAKLKEREKDKETLASFSKEYSETINKMKKGEATWPIEKTN